MYLSRLEILGFKSFAQRTVVEFNEGITAIVGPNGCGKTNIVDAIRWVLGEQRSGALRSDKMENVIFNGTSAKKPMGMSEVSLIVENTRGVLPTEYSDVTISRRIFRSGESEYLLNRNVCRLKDITNLFMDTGMGANAYSVIELKMVETILSNKADDRRAMFEEAAGVNKYKHRRRLALRKLDEVKSDLTRVNDIVSEVEKQVRSLERQAKKADKYNKLTATLRELELDLSERQFTLFNQTKDEFKEKKENSFQKKIEIDSDLAKLEDEIADVKQKLREKEYQLKSKRSEVSSVTEKIFDVRKHISVSDERKNSLEQNIERYKQELEELNIQLEETIESIEEGKVIVRELDQKLTEKREEKSANEETVNKLKIDLEEKRNKLKEQSDILLEKYKLINNKENELSNLNKSLQTKNEEIKKLNDKIQSLTGNVAKTVGYIEELEEEQKSTQDKIEEAEKHYTQKQKEKDRLEKELDELKNKELDVKSVINNIRDKINFIRTLIDNLEGVSKGAKALLENGDWAASNKTLLAHIGNSEDKYRFAVEASLKNNLNNILVDTFEDLKNGIEYLKSNEIGKAAFYVTGTNEKAEFGFVEKLVEWKINRKAKSVVKEDGFIGWTKDLIETDNKWKPFLNKILKTTVVVDDLETALNLSSKYPQFSFASLNGDFVDDSGYIEAGSKPKLDDSLFGRKKLLEELKNQFPEKEKELLELRKTIEAKEDEISHIDLKVLSDRGRLLVNDLSNVEKQISQFEFEKNKAKDEIEKARSEIQNLASDYNNLDNDKNNLEVEINGLKEEQEKEDQLRIELEEEFNEVENNYNEIINKQNLINLEIERLEGERKNTENSITRSKNSIETIERSIEKRKFDIQNSEEEAVSLTSIIDESKDEEEELEGNKAVLIKEENRLDEEYNEIQNEISEKESTQSRLRKERENVSDLIHEAEIKLNELNLKLNNLKENIKDDYSVTLELKEFDDLDTFNFEEKSDEVHSLKQQVKNLGPINLLAYSEFEEERERLDFLHNQRDDLIESEKDIVQTIEEINQTAQTQFLDVFNQIRESFVKIFRNLFNPGDEADLKLEEDSDPLEGKIEIIAKPKGKRPTSIELLSGGEKTLTAIALLFAIYLVKPSPFCILDEIDAPLDDANIDRFTKIIRDFSKDTQFIVVTHNKRTMEAADTLYGVTMQEEGISKLVSVRFNEDLDFVKS